MLMLDSHSRVRIDPKITAIFRLVKSAGPEGISASTLKINLPDEVEKITGISRRDTSHWAASYWSVDRIKGILEEVDDDHQSGRMFELNRWGKYRLNTRRF